MAPKKAVKVVNDSVGKIKVKSDDEVKVKAIKPKKVKVIPEDQVCGICGTEPFGKWRCDACQSNLCKKCVDLKHGCKCCENDEYYCKECASSNCFKKRGQYTCEIHEKHC